MKNNVPSKAQVRGWKISTTRAGDAVGTVHHDITSKPVLADAVGLGKTLRDRCPVCVRTLAVPQVTQERGGAR